MERNQDMTRNLIVTALVAVLMAGFVLAYIALAPTQAQSAMGGAQEMEAIEGPVVPPVRGYAEGEEILFLHTEASDPEVASMLTEMMGSPVLVVPVLADAPESMLAPVYVFTNGIEGMGPLGYQPDVFSDPPGTVGYTPLREIQLVTWTDEANARLLTSAAEVQEAAEQRDVTIEARGAVVNMPFLTWPDGQR